MNDYRCSSALVLVQVVDASLSAYRGAVVGISGAEDGLIGQGSTASPLQPSQYTLAFQGRSGVQMMFTLTSLMATAGLFDGLQLAVRSVVVLLSALHPTGAVSPPSISHACWQFQPSRVLGCAEPHVLLCSQLCTRFPQCKSLPWKHL